PLGVHQLLTGRPKDAGAFWGTGTGGNDRQHALAHFGMETILFEKSLSNLAIESLENDVQVRTVVPRVEVERPCEGFTEALLEFLGTHERLGSEVARLLVRSRRGGDDVVAVFLLGSGHSHLPSDRRKSSRKE